MRFKTLADWLQWQEQLHHSEIELGLERVKSVAQQLPFFKKNNTSKKIITITVAGTNGKGSCVAYLEAILCAAGYRVGCYSSPHLLYYNERVRLNGEMVSDQLLCESFERVDQARAVLNTHEISLTYFEFGTLAALDIFQQAHVDIQILEVGLGGRLDAVNIIEPDAAVVVNVALDHEALLGNSREAIGYEKAGIFRAGIPLIVGEPDPPSSIRKAASLLGNPRLSLYGQHFVIEEDAQKDIPSWRFTGTDSEGRSLVWEALPKGHLPLPSAACALQVIAELHLADRPSIEKGLKSAFIPGRYQTLEWQGRRVILDVAHNPAAAEYLVKRLAHDTKGKISVVFSALADKDHAGLMAALAPSVNIWYLAPLPVLRAASLESLLESAASVRGIAQGFDTIGAALQAAQVSTQQDDTILVCGSFYTVAAALRHMQ